MARHLRHDHHRRAELWRAGGDDARAGGQYIYLREALGKIWGFLFGWTLFLVIQTGTIAAVAVAFGKFLGVFFPSVSTTNWVWFIGHVPPWHVGPMVLGNMDIGVSTANLAGIVIILLLALINVFGVKLGALVQNVFTTAKTVALLGLVVLGVLFMRNASAIHANFGAQLLAPAGTICMQCRWAKAAPSPWSVS